MTPHDKDLYQKISTGLPQGFFTYLEDGNSLSKHLQFRHTLELGDFVYIFKKDKNPMFSFQDSKLEKAKNYLLEQAQQFHLWISVHAKVNQSGFHNFNYEDEPYCIDFRKKGFFDVETDLEYVDELGKKITNAKKAYKFIIFDFLGDELLSARDQFFKLAATNEKDSENTNFTKVFIQSLLLADKIPILHIQTSDLRFEIELGPKAKEILIEIFNQQDLYAEHSMYTIQEGLGGDFERQKKSIQNALGHLNKNIQMKIPVFDRFFCITEDYVQINNEYLLENKAK